MHEESLTFTGDDCPCTGGPQGLSSGLSLSCVTHLVNLNDPSQLILILVNSYLFCSTLTLYQIDRYADRRQTDRLDCHFYHVYVYHCFSVIQNYTT